MCASCSMRTHPGHEPGTRWFGNSSACSSRCPEKPLAGPQEFSALGVEENEERLAIEGKDFLVLFSKVEGRILAYHANGRDLLHSGPVEQYYRAPTDIDLLMHRPSASIWKWRGAGIDRLERAVRGFEWGRSAHMR